MLRGKNVTVSLLVAGNLCAVLLWISALSYVEGKYIGDPVKLAQTQNATTFQGCGDKLIFHIRDICKALLNTNTNIYYAPAVEPPRTSTNSSSEEIQQQRLKTNAVYLRNRRGVTDECCKKPCKTVQLLKYCASPVSTNETTSTTSTPPPGNHHLHKRTSSAESNKNESKLHRHSIKPRQPHQSASNCLHCARNKKRSNKKPSECRISSRGKKQRRKSRMEEEQSLLLALLFQLLWGWDPKGKSIQAMHMKNVFPRNSSPELPVRRQKPVGGRGITARDIYQNQFSFLQSHFLPPLDGTSQATIGVGERNISNVSIDSNASVVIDEQHELFNTPAGTNPDDTTNVD